MNPLADNLMSQDGRVPSFWRYVSLVGASLVLILASANLAGWLIGSELLTSWISGIVPMKISGALTLLVIGSVLLRLAIRQKMEPTDRHWLRAASIVALIAGTAGIVSGIMYRVQASSIDLTPLLARQIAFDPLRIPIAAGVSFLLTAIALWFLQKDWAGSKARASAWALASAANALLTLLGFAYGVESYFTQQTYVPMPLPAAVTLLLVSLTIVTVQPTGGLLTAILSTASSGKYARRILAAAILVPFLLGLAHVQISRSGLLAHEFTQSVEVLLLITILSTFIFMMVVSFHTRDERERELRSERDREAGKRQMMWDLSRDMMVIATPDGRLVDVNPACTSVLGWSREELLSRPYEEFLHPDDRGTTRDEVERLFDSQSSLLFVNRFRSSDGSYKTLQWHSAVREDNGEIFGIARDVTEVVRGSEELRDHNRELETRVRLRTRALETANRELESFSYAVSHDLRAPLRAIEGFSRMVIERHAQELPEEGQHYLERVRVAAARMGEIIDGLLVLSRLSRGELRIEDVDLSEIAKETVEDLRAADHRKVSVEIEPGMHATGDHRLLRSLLQNLISNAWKFTKGKDPAIIEIGSRSQGHDREFFVRDNGAGFDSRHMEKLFQPFQRLHSIEEFDGTGLGLATVRRVVNRHGGTAWAEGAVGRGATFWFSLPAPDRGADNPVQGDGDSGPPISKTEDGEGRREQMATRELT